MDLPEAYEDLVPKHFPLFITVKQLLFMLDASLNYSFFTRDKSNKVVCLENNLTWHNENKGLFMINAENRSVQNCDDLLLKYANELIEGEDMDAQIFEEYKEEEHVERRTKVGY